MLFLWLPTATPGARRGGRGAGRRDGGCAAWPAPPRASSPEEDAEYAAPERTPLALQEQVWPAQRGTLERAGAPPGGDGSARCAWHAGILDTLAVRSGFSLMDAYARGAACGTACTRAGFAGGGATRSIGRRASMTGVGAASRRLRNERWSLATAASAFTKAVAAATRSFWRLRVSAAR